MFYVDVQNPKGGEWLRRFYTLDEAERYKLHAIYKRGYCASIRKCLSKREVYKYL